MLIFQIEKNKLISINERKIDLEKFLKENLNVKNKAIKKP